MTTSRNPRPKCPRIIKNPLRFTMSELTCRTRNPKRYYRKSIFAFTVLLIAIIKIRMEYVRAASILTPGMKMTIL